MSLVAQYLFADAVASPTAIDSVAAHNGTAAGDAFYNGCSLEVTGHSLSTFASSSNAALSPGSAGALMAWASWPASLSALLRDSTNGNGWMLVGRKSGDTTLSELIYRVGGTEVHTGLSLTFLSTRLTHYAITWDGSGSSFYINGAKLYDGPAPGATSATLPWRYGKNGFFSEYWPGRIADMRLYDTRLNAAAVSAIAAVGSPCDAAVVDFEGTPLEGVAPLAVQFIDLSSGVPISWSWNFGDGHTSTSQSPLHSYTSAGTYDVALTVTYDAGPSTTTKTAYVVVHALGTPGVYFDWDSDGFETGTYDDCTSLTMSWTINRGASPELTGGASPGGMTLVLNNTTDRFNPENASGPLYGLLTDGVPVWVGIDDAGRFAGPGANGLFAGRITDITPIPGDGSTVPPTVEIVCADPLEWYARRHVSLADSRTRSQADLRAAALTAAGETNVDLPDEPRGLPLSGADASLASVLDALNSANGTRHFIKPADNYFDWYDYTARNRIYKLGSAADASLTGSDHVTTTGWRKTAAVVINQQRASVTPLSFRDFNEVVWQAETLPIIAHTPHDDIVVWATFDDYVDGATLEYTSTTASTAVMTSFGRTAKIVISDAGPIHVDFLRIIGRKVQRGQDESVVVDDLTSQAEPRGIREGSAISGDYVGTRAAAFGFATHIVWRFAQPQYRPTLSAQNWLPDQFELDLFDLIAFTSTQIGVTDRLFEIVGLTHTGVVAATAAVLHVVDYVLQESRQQTPETWFTWDSSLWDGDDPWAYL